VKRHVFIIGDLIVDHDIFVRGRATSSSNSQGTESHLDIIRRQDTAGGAANSARILAILNEGETYLWGVVGKCHWGNFRTILEGSHAIDGAQKLLNFGASAMSQIRRSTRCHDCFVPTALNSTAGMTPDTRTFLMKSAQLQFSITSTTSKQGKKVRMQSLSMTLRRNASIQSLSRGSAFCRTEPSSTFRRSKV
jgi:hypothetical protein